MPTTLQIDEAPIRLAVHLPMDALTDAQFLAFCQANPELRLERNAQGEIIVMSPTGAESSYRNLLVGAALFAWAVSDGSGSAFDSSGGFRLPDGAIRSPDAAWVRRARLAGLTSAAKRGFLPLCPDFVVEVRSETDRLEVLLAKMAEYMANGAQLGWLIDPLEGAVHVFRPGAAPQRLARPQLLAGDPELPGFRLALDKLWEVDL